MLAYSTEKECSAPTMIPMGIVTVSRAAEISGYTPSYVSRLARKGRVRGEQVGNQWMIDLQSLLDYKSQVDAEGPAKHARRYDDAAE